MKRPKKKRELNPTKYCNMGRSCRNLAFFHIGPILTSRMFACGPHSTSFLQVRTIEEYKAEYEPALIEAGLMRVARSRT